MDASVIGVMGTVLGVLLAGPITYYYSRVLVERTHKNAIDLMARQEINRADTAFRCAFIDELCLLEDSTDERPDFTRKTIINAFPKHFRAYITYRAILTAPERNILTKKWDHYCEVHDELGVMLPCEKKEYRFSKYVSGTKEEEQERRLIAIRDINSLFVLHCPPQTNKSRDAARNAGMA